ncbi:MAG: hypothetical protein EHM58_05400 [Ignavibacteriae bacterium]|nr:MAG: hypothetical protein EHM58_05400 [Ignavibacteriota bacterium]
MNIYKSLFFILILICFITNNRLQAQYHTDVLIKTTNDDEYISLSTDKPVYISGDTIHLKLHRENDTSSISLTPVLPNNGISFTAENNNTYTAVIPLNVIPGLFNIRLNVQDKEKRRYVYDTDCIIEIEENKTFENIGNYISFEPIDGSVDLKKPVTLDKKQVQNLKIVFLRDKISEQMGPQFVIIKTTVISREGNTLQTIERRVMTFKSHGDVFIDRIKFNQYRAAYGPYSATSYNEINQVQLYLDSLPDWAVIKVSVEPDYLIKIGIRNQPNAVTRFFQLKGPTIELGFFLGFPKVLYDSRAYDTTEYGNTSAMLRFYYVNSVTGHRLPVNLGIGTFGVNSPFNLNKGRGGFAISLFLDVIDILEQISIYVPAKINKVSLGFDVSPFFPIKKKWRILVNAYIGYTF